jgi:hypothetical protein
VSPFTRLVVLAVPSPTCSNCAGLVVPIPTLPFCKNTVLTPPVPSISRFVAAVMLVGFDPIFIWAETGEREAKDTKPTTKNKEIEKWRNLDGECIR